MIYLDIRAALRTGGKFKEPVHPGPPHLVLLGIEYPLRDLPELRGHGQLLDHVLHGSPGLIDPQGGQESHTLENHPHLLERFKDVRVITYKKGHRVRIRLDVGDTEIRVHYLPDLIHPFHQSRSPRKLFTSKDSDTDQTFAIFCGYGKL